MAFGLNTYTPPATKNLIIINCLCFLASIALPKFFGIDIVNLLGLHYVGAEAFNPVQFLTYMFLHDTS
ncbi:MAG: rhomboid family intramembrane serine protease, partial [Paludibacteraceae bacterium]|nr:rhomboid family intramembrane serine protease [Paludibacteraceae bacterium]